jgi:hypothetical protein
MTTITALDVGGLAELAPLLRRAVSLDPVALVRVRIVDDAVSALVRLPFGVLVGRRIPVGGTAGSTAAHDGAYGAAALLAWLDGAETPPSARDAEWRGGVPPTTGWQRVETVPDDVIRGLVRAGASTLSEAAVREGHPGAEPRAEVADALLDSVVLTVSVDPVSVDPVSVGPASAEAAGPAQRAPIEINLRLLSALVRMGFLARESHLAIDSAGRWIRLAASYGSAYTERPGLGLGVVARAHQHGGIGR